MMPTPMNNVIPPVGADPDIRNRLDQLIRQSGESYAAISRRIGRNPAYIQQFIRRGTPRRLSELDRRLLAHHFHIPESELGAPAPPAIQAALPPAVQPVGSQLPAVSPACVLIPCIAHPAAYADHGTVALDAALVSAIAGPGTALAAHVAQGDAMVPTISPGDYLLIATGERQARRDGIYVLAGDHAPMVRRIALHPISGRISVVCDNPSYPDWPDCDPATVPIIGRLIWVARAVG